jgi:hypothetical protein
MVSFAIRRMSQNSSPHRTTIDVGLFFLASIYSLEDRDDGNTMQKWRETDEDCSCIHFPCYRSISKQ